MNETLFIACNLTATIGWLMLVFMPDRRLTSRLLCPVIIPSLLAIAYVSLLATNLGSTEGGFGSLEGVTELFANEQILLAGWIHYLVLDLFTGSWEIRDSKRIGIRHRAVVPCLLATFLFGPAGLLCYLSLRRYQTGQWSLQESSSPVRPTEGDTRQSLSVNVPEEA